MERISIDQYTEEEFIEKYESQLKPCVITGSQDTWSATENWTQEVKIVRYLV